MPTLQGSWCEFSLQMRVLVHFAPVGLELVGFGFNQVHRADNASVVPDCDLD